MTTRDDEMFAAGDGSAGSERCAWVRDRLPLRGLGILPARERGGVEAHLETCAGCAAEARMVAMLQEHAPRPPASILAGVLERVERRPARLPTPASPDWRQWTIRAAAVLALALGVGVIWGGEGSSDPAWAMALEPDAPSWYGAEWVVAGQPVPEALPDEVLRELIQEIEQ